MTDTESPSGYAACPSHCCIDHGCKYSYARCPVVLRTVAQEFPCEFCGPGGPHTTAVPSETEALIEAARSHCYGEESPEADDPFLALATHARALASALDVAERGLDDRFAAMEIEAAALTARATAAERMVLGLREAAQAVRSQMPWPPADRAHVDAVFALDDALANAAPLAIRLIAEAEQRGRVAALDEHHGTPCEQVRHAEQVADLTAALTASRAELARMREALVRRGPSRAECHVCGEETYHAGADGPLNHATDCILAESNEPKAEGEAMTPEREAEVRAVVVGLDDRDVDEPDRIIIGLLASLDAARAERDRLAAALVEVREAVEAPSPLLAWRRILAILASTPTDLAAARDARVRAEALREAADAYSVLTDHGGGDWTVVRAWLRSRADDIEGKR